ncbi:uncharacterized protein LOC112875012 isoform X2 [Panicum hallii]|uniref:uncharacterized protein LOC112875012 isoform X2 n=1 Tax=Panicum hallii TaxID=206008 RepID=UPI000DF4CF91|nr:uncharacterized protein LOC112875012 isoform X2 [Panicum hallii]
MVVETPDTNPEMSLLERRNDKDRERTIKKYHGMTDEQKADRNARKQANRYRSIFDAGATIANNKDADAIDGACITTFGTCTLAIEDDVTPEEQKRENERKRYHDMGGLARNEKIIKIIESCKKRNIENQGKHVDTPVTGTLQSALTQQQSGRVTRACTRNIDRDDQFDSDLWEPYDPMHGVEENDLDQMNLMDYGLADIEDDEACIFHHQDFQYEYAMDRDIGFKGSDCTRIFRRNTMS